jgi:hypothetical protein
MKYLPWGLLGLVGFSFYLHYQLMDWGGALSPKRDYYFASLLRLDPTTFARAFILLVCAGASAYALNLIRVYGAKAPASGIVLAVCALASFSLAVAEEFPAYRKGLLIKAMTAGFYPTYHVSREEYPDLLEVPSIRKMLIAERASHERIMVYAALRLEGLSNQAILEQYPDVIIGVVQFEGAAALEGPENRYLQMLKRYRAQPEGTFRYGLLPYAWAKETLRSCIAKGVPFPLEIVFLHPGLVTREDSWRLMELLASGMKKDGRPVQMQETYIKNIRLLHGFLAGKAADGKAGLSVALQEEGGSAGPEKLVDWQKSFFKYAGDMVRLCGYEVEAGDRIKAAVKIRYETRPGTVWRTETRTVKKLIQERQTRYSAGELETKTVEKWVEEDEQRLVSYKATLTHYPRASIVFEAGAQKIELAPPRLAASDDKGGTLLVDVLKPGEYRVDASNEPDYLASPWSWDVFQ